MVLSKDRMKINARLYNSVNLHTKVLVLGLGYITKVRWGYSDCGI